MAFEAKSRSTPNLMKVALALARESQENVSALSGSR
jgi:hypothetical protein